MNKQEKALRLKNRRLELLIDTARDFTLTTRAVRINDTCTYSHLFNGGCAIGRKVSAKRAELLDSCSCVGVIGDEVFNLLPNKLKGLGREFLRDVQNLHDFPENWDKSGLSSKGLESVEQIKKKHNLI